MLHFAFTSALIRSLDSPNELKDETHTSVDGRDHALDNDDRQPVKTSQDFNNLANRRQLGDHVQEERNKRDEAQV